MRGALTIFTNQITTAATTSSVKVPVKIMNNGNEITNTNTDAPVEFEEINDNHNAQLGMNNVGSVGRIDIFPLHVQSLTGIAVVISVIFGMVVVFRATRRDSLKKMLKLCFPGRAARVQQQRAQEIEMGRMRSGLPDVVLNCPPETVEDRIRDTVAQLNLLTMQRNGMRQETGSIPRVVDSREFIGSGSLSGKCSQEKQNAKE